MFLHRDDRIQLISAFRELSGFESEGSRHALKYVAGLGFLNVDLSGNALTFASNLISACERAGTLPDSPNFQALGALLNYLISLQEIPYQIKLFSARVIAQYELIGEREYLLNIISQYNLGTLVPTPWIKQQQQQLNNRPVLFDVALEHPVTKDLGGIIDDLHDWKIVHFFVQRLLLSLLGWRGSVELCRECFELYHTTSSSKKRFQLEVAIRTVEDYYHSSCQRKVYELRGKLGELRSVRHDLLGSLTWILDPNYENYIEKALYRVQIDEPGLFRRMHRSYSELYELLVEVLELADRYILWNVDRIQDMRH